MKTPRDILLAQHRAAGPKLDAIRRALVAELNHEDKKAQSWLAGLVSSCLRGSNVFWRELILPSRRIWAGLAAVWFLIVAVNVSQREHLPGGNISAGPVMMSFSEQQRLLNELFADRAPVAEADRPQKFSPKPRTEKIRTAAV